MRKLSYILIVVGLLVLAYPKGSEWYAEWQQDKLMAAWETSYVEIPEVPAQQQFGQLTNLFNEADVQEEEIPVETVAVQPTSTPVEPIGTILIDRIGVKLPILEGATQKNMKYGAAHLKETAAFGEVGNTAIAAHRAKTKGRLFNRLGEVKIGDKITIVERDKEYTYTVYETLIVEPTDVSVLNYNHEDKLLTLITCTPIVNPTHRLIIHAKM